MPYPMIHLVVADHIRNRLHEEQAVPIPEGFDTGLYFLGSLAPDAVHFRQDFHKEMKKITHLTPEWEEWGVCDDNDAWYAAIKEKLFPLFFEKNGFYLGYIVHTMTDMRWNIEHWTPFRRNYLQDPSKLYSSGMHAEQAELELRLYLEYEHTSRIMQALRGATPEFSIADFLDIRRQELLDMRDNITEKQYAGRHVDRHFVPKHLSRERLHAFIRKAADDIYAELAVFFSVRSVGLQLDKETDSPRGRGKEGFDE